MHSRGGREGGGGTGRTVEAGGAAGTVQEPGLGVGSRGGVGAPSALALQENPTQEASQGLAPQSVGPLGRSPFGLFP